MTHHPFGFDKAEDSHVFLLWQTTIMWQRIIKQALEPYDIAHAQFVIMASLMWFSIKDIEATQVLIAGHSKLDKMTISKSIKKLITSGYVNREENKTDSRAKTATLTQKGKELISRLIPIVRGIDAQFFGKLDACERKSLIGILSKLIV